MSGDSEPQEGRVPEAMPAREALPSNVTIRHADANDLLDVVRVLDGAALETDVEVIRRRLGADSPRVFVAVADAVSSESSTERVVGALVLDSLRASSPGDFEIEQVAVRRRRRGRGIGRALVGAACGFAREQAPSDATATVTARFDRTVRPFYEACGFEIVDDPDLESGDGPRPDRLRARRQIDTRKPH